MSDGAYISFEVPQDDAQPILFRYRSLPNGRWLMTVRQGERLIAAETMPYIYMLWDEK